MVSLLPTAIADAAGFEAHVGVGGEEHGEDVSVSASVPMELGWFENAHPGPTAPAVIEDCLLVVLFSPRADRTHLHHLPWHARPSPISSSAARAREIAINASSCSCSGFASRHKRKGVVVDIFCPFMDIDVVFSGGALVRRLSWVRRGLACFDPHAAAVAA